MIGHLSLGVRDLERAIQFYDAALIHVGWVRVWSSPTGAGYGPEGGNDKLALFPHPDARVPLAAGPGFHLAFNAPSRAQVHQFHEAALLHGGQCEGEPGARAFRG